jgi:hypothetical protein
MLPVGVAKEVSMNLKTQLEVLIGKAVEVGLVTGRESRVFGILESIADDYLAVRQSTDSPTQYIRFEAVVYVGASES